MSEPIHNPRIAAVLPSLTDVMFLMPLAFLFARAEGARDMIEGDTGWHIRAGEWMLAHGQVVRTDSFSFTKPGEPWFAWEWLWDVGAALLHQRWGLGAVVLASLLVLCVTSALLFRLVLRYCPYRIPAAAITFVALAATSVHWWARPHLLSWLFTVVTLWVIAWHESGERRLLWTLPFLTALWANVHGGFLIVLIILGCYAAAYVLAGLLEYLKNGATGTAKLATPYALTALACLMASFANPYTYALHLHVFGFLGGSAPIFQNVAEWQSISFHHPAALFVEALLAGAGISIVQSLRHGRYAEVLLMLGWMHMALRAARHIPVFALVAAPVIARAVTELAAEMAANLSGGLGAAWSGLLRFESDFAAIDRWPRVYLTSAVVTGLVIWAALLPAPPDKLTAIFSPKRYPVKAIDSLSAKAFEGRVFTDDEWGDYLIYRLTPSVKVFIDGRADFYGGKHMEEYLEILACKHDWDRRLAVHKIDRVLLPAGHCLATTIKESLRWSTVYDDGTSILFRRREGGAGASSFAGKDDSKS